MLRGLRDDKRDTSHAISRAAVDNGPTFGQVLAAGDKKGGEEAGGGGRLGCCRGETLMLLQLMLLAISNFYL